MQTSTFYKINKIKCFDIDDDTKRSEYIQLLTLMINKKNAIETERNNLDKNLTDIIEQLDTIDFFKNTFKIHIKNVCSNKVLHGESTDKIRIEYGHLRYKNIYDMQKYIDVLIKHAKNNFVDDPLLKKYNDIVG